MELEHTFTVPVAADEAFRVLRDIERIGPCMPGATVESAEGEEFSGKVKVKVGPIQVTYRGTAVFVEVDEEGHAATIEARAKETRGPGTANATIRATCRDSGGVTEVRVVTDLAITGKPAQFGRGVMAEVGDKLLGQFADCLAEELGAGGPGAVEAPEAVPPGAAPTASAADERTAAATAPVPTGVGGPAGTSTSARPPTERGTDDTIDLLGVAGGPVARRAAPVAVAAALVLLVVWIIRRR